MADEDHLHPRSAEARLVAALIGDWPEAVHLYRTEPEFRATIDTIAGAWPTIIRALADSGRLRALARDLALSGAMSLDAATEAVRLAGRVGPHEGAPT